MQVKTFNVLKYDPECARSYCIEHLPHALKLDTAAFEKTAKTIPLDFVTMTTEARVQIASDLSTYLTEHD